MAILLTTLPESAITMRYREPYLSKSLNAKLQTLLSPGIYSGLEITPGAVALRVEVSPGVASVQSDADSGAQITIQLTGSYELDLASFPASAEIAICIEAAYLFNTTTTAVIRGYNLSTETVPSTSCVLGVVTRPATSIVIPVANVSPTMRTLPWETRTAQTVPRVQTVRNGNFSLATSGGTPEFWSYTGTTGTLSALAASPAGPSGFGKTVQATATSAGAAQNGALVQYLAQPINPALDRVGIYVAYRALQAPTFGNPAILLYFKQPDTNTAYFTVTLPLTAAVAGTYTEYVKVYDLASLAGTAPVPGLYLERVEIAFNGAQYAAASAAFRVTDLQVTVESRSNAGDPQHEMGGVFRGTTLKLLDPTDMSASGSSATFTYDAATDTVYLTGPNIPNLDLPADLDVAGDTVLGGTLTVTGPIYIATLDFAGTMNIGPTLQTTLNIGRSASPLNLIGSTISNTTTQVSITGTAAGTVPLTIKGASGQTAALTTWTDPAGTTTLAQITAAGNLQVTASVDRLTAGVLALGGTTANGVTLARASINTDVLGPLRVLSSIDRIAAGTLTIAGSTATALALGGNAALTTLDIGVGTPTLTRTINIGTGLNTAGRTIAINIGTGNANGTSTTNIQGDTLTLGTDADTGLIQLGNATRTVSVYSNTDFGRKVVIRNTGPAANIILKVEQNPTAYDPTSGNLQEWWAFPVWDTATHRVVASLDPAGVMRVAGLDEIAAYPLEIGGSVATAVAIGRTTIATTVLGSLTVNENATILPVVGAAGTTLTVRADTKGSAQAWRDVGDSYDLARLTANGELSVYSSITTPTYFTTTENYRSIRFSVVEQYRLYDPYVANGTVTLYTNGATPSTAPMVRIEDAAAGSGASDVYFSWTFSLPPGAYVYGMRCGLLVYNQGFGLVQGRADVTLSCYRIGYNTTVGTDCNINSGAVTVIGATGASGAATFGQVVRLGGNSALTQGDPDDGADTYRWKATARIYVPEVALAGAAQVDVLYFDIRYATTTVRV